VAVKVRATLSQVQLLSLFSGKMITVNLPPGATEVHLLVNRDVDTKEDLNANRVLKRITSRLWGMIDKVTANLVK
jgi:hypothetical protein